MQLWQLGALIGGAHVSVLAVLVVVIRKILLGDTMKAIARIREVETEVRKKEESIQEEIAEHEKEFERKKVEAEDALQRQKEESEKELSLVRDQITAEARKEGDRIIDQAKKNEEKMKQQLLQEMEEKAVTYGGDVFELVFSEKVTGELNRAFIGELLDALEEVDAGSITVDAEDAEFISSHAIEPDQKERLEALLKEKFSADVKVDEKIDPNLMAGLVFKLGSLEIDGSLRNRYQEAAAELKKAI